MAPEIKPAIDPLPASSSIYRSGHGQLHRLTLVAVPKQKQDREKFAAALPALARQRIEERRRQEVVTRGEVKLLPRSGGIPAASRRESWLG